MPPGVGFPAHNAGDIITGDRKEAMRGRFHLCLQGNHAEAALIK